MNRRDFLGWAATGAAGILLPTLVRPVPKVFDMGRGPRRAWGPRALIYDAWTGRFVREIPVEDRCDAGYRVQAADLPVGPYRMEIIEEHARGADTYVTVSGSPGLIGMRWHGPQGTFEVVRRGLNG